MYNGKRYFTTPPLHGAFVRFEDIRAYLAPKTTQARAVGRFKSAATRGLTDFVGSQYSTRAASSRSRSGSREASVSPTRRPGSGGGAAGVRLEPLQHTSYAATSSHQIARDASGSAEAELRLRQQLLRAKLERAQALGEQFKVEEELRKREEAKENASSDESSSRPNSAK